MKILILDDDTDLCSLLKMFFERRGHMVLMANTLIDGLTIIDEHEPLIVFIDNVLPDGEGWKAAKTIKYKHPEIKINLMSGKDKSFASTYEEDDFIWEKPITSTQLETYLQFIKK
jgi:DNA-binding NtrC family response regulator